MRKERLQYWLDSAEFDFKVAERLLSNHDYLWCLFVSHLVIEKILKAIYVQNIELDAPHLHDLSRLAELAGLQLTQEQEDFMDKLTDFNIRTRYPDYKLAMYKIANREYTIKLFDKIREYKEWLVTLIEK